MKNRAISLVITVASLSVAAAQAQQSPATMVAADARPDAAPAPGKLHLDVVDIIPKSMSGEIKQDSEPFLTVSLSNPSFMIATALTRNPIPGANTAPVFVSTDNGKSWWLKP